MSARGTSKISIAGVDFHILEDCIEYTFQVQLGSGHWWNVNKIYDDFQALNEELVEMYGARQVPYLTGEVAFWKKLRVAVAEERLPKLEAYLAKVLDFGAEWEPKGLVVQVVHPVTRAQITINKFIFDFCEFLNYRPLFEAETRTLNADLPAAPTPPAAPSPLASMAASPYASLMSTPRGTKAQPEPTVAETLASSSAITSQVRVQVKNFVIYPKDRIDYNVHVSLTGHSWHFPVRFSEVERFHQELTTVYGAVCVPNLEGARVPFWKSCDEDTGKLRQKHFEGFFREIVREIDGWSPSVLVSFVLDRKNQGRTTVFISKLIFDFFGFEDHVDALSGDQAERVVQMQQDALPDTMRAVLTQEKDNRRRDVIQDRLRAVSELLTPASDTDIVELCTFIEHLDDDKDVLNVVKFFCHNGFVNRDVESLEGVPDVTGPTRKMIAASKTSDGQTASSKGSSPAISPRESAHAFGQTTSMMSFKALNMVPAASSSKAVYFTGAQVAQIAACVFFNDTRCAVIRMLANVLGDDGGIDSAYDTLIYEWDDVKADVEDTLAGTKKART